MPNKFKFKSKLTASVMLFSLFASAFLIFTLFNFSAFADQELADADIQGVTNTDQILVNGIANVGAIHFDDPPTASKKARLKVTVQDGGALIDLETKGWAQTENVGWVSFACTNGSNEGTPCSDGDPKYNHLVTFDSNGQAIAGSYAWNPVTGWISFTSLNHSPPIAFNYGVQIDTSTGDFSGYAWSQSMGWIQFDGITADLPAFPPQPPKTVTNCDDHGGVCVRICNSSGDCSIDSLPIDDVAVADGADYYEIHIFLKKQDKAPITKAELLSGDYKIKALLNWTDTVKADQTVYGAETIDDGYYALNYIQKPLSNTSNSNNGAVLYKPVLLYSHEGMPVVPGFDKFSSQYQEDINDSKQNILKPEFQSMLASGEAEWNEANGEIILKVKAAAPTTGENISYMISQDGVTESSTEVLNESFSGITPNPLGKDADGDAIALEQNNLKLSTIKWLVETPGPSFTGEYFVENAGGEPASLRFRPALSIKTLLPEYAPWNTLWAYRGVPTKLEIEGEDVITNENLSGIKPGFYPPMVEIAIENKEGGAEVKFDIDTEDLDEGESIGPENTSIIKAFSNLSNTTWPFFIEAELGTEDAPAAEYTEGGTLYTTISYTFLNMEAQGMKDIAYYSNRLPRLIEESISNPVAVIGGNIYSQYTKQLQEGVSATAVGDPSVNIARDTVYENVKKLIRDRDMPTHQQSLTLSSFTPAQCKKDQGCITFTLNKDEANEEHIYYADVDLLILDGGADIGWTANTTLIVSGNLAINSNLCKTATCDDLTKKLGIVVLREINDGIGEAGHIYVAPSVTNIQAFIAAWGTLFSYDGASGSLLGKIVANTGEFNWEGAYLPGVLDYQLVLQGGLLSMNTLGGADFDDFYMTGDGRVLDKGEAYDSENQKTAQLYDLNYFRYFRLKVPGATGTLDLSCGKELNGQDIQNISLGVEVSGPNGVCNGINAQIPYDSDDNEKLGDLVVADPDKMAKGTKSTPLNIAGFSLAETESSNPFYINYVPPVSVVFSQEKSLTF